MKSWIILPLLAAVVAGARAQQQRDQDSPMQDAATHDQLEAKLRSVASQDPLRDLEVAKGPDPLKAKPRPDLLSQSDFLCLEGSATLVPKGAVLHVPDNLAGRMKLQPEARIQSWLDFFAKNRGWITTVEVTRAQAEGNEPMDEETRTRYLDGGRLVVATFHGGPISVLPPKEPAPDGSSAQPEAGQTDKNQTNKKPTDETRTGTGEPKTTQPEKP